MASQVPCVNRLVGSLPKVGIRPAIDGRRGGIRESLEGQTMGMAKGVAKLISERRATPAAPRSNASLPTVASAAWPRPPRPPRSSPAKASASR